MKMFLMVFVFACGAFGAQSMPSNQSYSPYFFSDLANEYQLSFDFVFRTEFKDISSIQRMSESAKQEYKQTYILSTLQYIYGPVTRLGIGNPQRGWNVIVDWQHPQLIQGRVYLPYHYSATWIIRKTDAKPSSLRVPVPYTAGDLMTPQWLKCTDSDPDHQTLSMYWYFWDPRRPGCDQKEGREFSYVQMHLVSQTKSTIETYPEYSRMIRNVNGKKQISFTFAFGYALDTEKFWPDEDRDPGMLQYQDFIRYIRAVIGRGYQETPILEKEYPSAFDPEKVMGHRFKIQKSGVEVVINVIAAGDIDQMIIFAQSFAHDHDGFFGWFGHSRVGSGFDADWMAYRLRTRPDYYSIRSDYQLVYWAGCNSYSYYTTPFFLLKSTPQDPNGTKGLDIISNGMPSLFILNSPNAKIVFNALWNFDRPTSYQTLVTRIEDEAASYGTQVLVNVLGDEDNP